MAAADVSLSDRIEAAIVASIVADAACMPLHWIYNVDDIDGHVAGGTIEFLDPPKSPYYEYPTGQNSPYGEYGFHLLQWVGEKGEFDAEAYSQDAYTYFKNEYKGRMNGSIKEFIANVEEGKVWPNCGADDHQADGFARVPVITGLYAGKPEHLSKVNDATRVFQNSDIGAAMALAGARILEKVILGTHNAADAITATVAELRADDREFATDADAQIADAIEASLAMKDSTYREAAAAVGLSCGAPFPIQNSAHLLTYTGTDDFVKYVQTDILGGGDQCSRLMFGAAVVAASNGPSCIPDEWAAKTNVIEEARAAAAAIAARRTAE